MKLAHILARITFATLALTLAPAFMPVQASTVTYGFTEGSNAPNPGQIGATITFASPPATVSSNWWTSTSSDILSVNIIDAALYPTGFTGTFTSPIIFTRQITSNTGSNLDDGFISDSSETLKLIINGTGDTTFADPNGAPDLLGVWAPVPEPASVVLAGIGSAIGLMLTSFRKR